MFKITEYEKQTNNGTEHGYRVHLKEYVGFNYRLIFNRRLKVYDEKGQGIIMG